MPALAVGASRLTRYGTSETAARYTTFKRMSGRRDIGAVDQMNASLFVAVLQAVAAVAAALFAWLLYRVTREYVFLTRTMARAAEAQVAHLQTALQGQRRDSLIELLELVRTLRERVNALPDSINSGSLDKAFRSSPLWTDDHLRSLRQLSLSLGPSGASAATSVESAMSRLLEQVVRIRSTSVSHGFRYDQMDWSAWSRARGSALDALGTLEELISDAQGVFTTEM
jgi:hypothetical protein